MKNKSKRTKEPKSKHKPRNKVIKNVAKNKNIINIKINTHRRRKASDPTEVKKNAPAPAPEPVYLPARTIYQQVPLQPVQNNNVAELERVGTALRNQEELFASLLDRMNNSKEATTAPAPAPAPVALKTPKTKRTPKTLPDDVEIIDGIQDLNEIDTQKQHDKLASEPKKKGINDFFGSGSQDPNMRSVIKELRVKFNEEAGDIPTATAVRDAINSEPINDPSSELVTRFKDFSGEIARLYVELQEFYKKNPPKQKLEEMSFYLERRKTGYDLLKSREKTMLKNTQQKKPASK